jgi:general secretion pathway protein A
MYQNYFGMTEAPFSIAPNPRYLYMSLRHQEALATLTYGLSCDGGFVVLTGEVGAGKTTICRCLLEQIPDNCDIAYIFNPKLTVMELLSTVCDEFHIKYPKNTTSNKEFVDLINTYLLKSHAQSRKAVLIIDEAQNLSAEVLEQMRLLTNLETNERKLLQILLVGQPELSEILARPDLRQLAQRVVARYHLKPLNKIEVRAYVKFRLEMAGVTRPVFSDAVLNKLYRLSGGVPRLINLLCDRALLGTFVQGKDRVDKSTLKQASREMNNPNSAPQSMNLSLLMIGLGLLVFSISVIVYFQKKNANAQLVEKVSHQDQIQALSTVPSKPREIRLSLTKPTLNLTKEIVDLPSTLNIPLDETYVHSKETANATLLRAWGVQYKEGEQLCTQAKAQGLHCWSMRGGLDELQQLDMPVALEMLSAESEKFYVTLIKLENQSATFDLGSKTSIVSLNPLAFQWTGNYTVLTRIPADVHENIGSNERGASVEWLRTHLAKFQGWQPGSEAATFNEDLKRRVQQFQLSQGLVPYGNAGPKTFLRLSALSDTSAPRLSLVVKGSN